MCTRTVSTLAHVLEAEGLTTVALSSIRSQVEQCRPPRALHCEFPIGRPLGKPNDAPFQRQVLDAAFALLREPTGPVLVDFPEEIADAADAPIACSLPPRHDASVPAAVEEARGLRSAYDRSVAANGRTLVGRTVPADDIPDAIACFLRIAEGTPWKEAKVPGHPMAVAKDILAYYEEAAGALVDHVPAARSTETWFFKSTAAGRALLDAKAALLAEGEGFAFYLTPFTQG